MGQGKSKLLNRPLYTESTHEEPQKFIDSRYGDILLVKNKNTQQISAVITRTIQDEGEF